MFQTVIEPRLSETDGLGHINNGVLPVWFEEARKGLFRIFNPTLSLKAWNLILKKFEIEIVQQIFHEEPVTIHTGIAHIGRTSFIVHQVAEQKGRKVAMGSTVLIHFDYGTNLPAPIPAVLIAELETHRIAADAQAE